MATPTGSNAVASQIAAEVVRGRLSTATARASQVMAEVVRGRLATAAARASSVCIEVVVPNSSQLWGRLSNLIIEVALPNQGIPRMTTFRPHPNNVSTTLAGAYTAGGTTLTLTAGTGPSFGSIFPMLVSVAQAASYGSPGEVNTIYSVTARTGDMLTIAAGGAEGTTDRNYAVGDRVDVRWTDGLAKSIEGAVNSLETSVASVQAGLLISQPNNTTGAYPLQITSTWNNAAQGFAAIVVQITDTASTAGSYLELMQVGGANKWTIDKTGKVITGAADAALITTGTIAPARLGTATPAGNKWLRGDGVWAPLFIANPYATTTTVADRDTFVYCNPGSAITLTMPSVANVFDQEFIFWNSTANAVTLQRAGSDVFLPGVGLTQTLAGVVGKYLRMVAVNGIGWLVTGSN
jgi:hypothetical protein